MAKCDACCSIVMDRRGERGHDALVETGSEKFSPIGKAAVTKASFVCSTCGTKWTYENDKNNSFAGWHEVEN
ncbi:MAG: hypothetical protein ACN6OP_09915 [Pseudomonadales bacterium]